MSVYHLMNDLCSSLAKEFSCENVDVDLQFARKIAFETLLKKSIEENVNSEKVAEEYQFLVFELLLLGRSADVKFVETFIQLFEKAPCDSLLNAAALLVKLKNLDPTRDEKKKHKFLELAQTTQQDLTKNKYFANIPLSGLSPPAHSITKTYNGASKSPTNFLSSILELNLGKKDGRLEQLKLKPINSATKVPARQIEKPKTSPRKSKYYTWENLSSNTDIVNKSFCSEVTDNYIFQRISVHTKNKSTKEIVSVSFPKLLSDIKLLLIGIESESFKRTSETLIFQPTKRFCCNSLSSLDGVIEKFLETGTCFKRLKVYTGKNPFNQNQIFSGFMFRAFCDRVIKFLNYCRDIIYSQETQSLLELYTNTEKIRRIITHLSMFLKIHPSVVGGQSVVPHGSEFLKLLYDEYYNTVNREVKCFYIELLKSCCEVYYLRLQEWFYHGKLEDPHEEMFIYFVDNYNINTKYYFDRAFIIRKPSIPSFLTTCADNILLCGKYTDLLKSYNSMHPLLTMRKPSFKICLTFEEIDHLKEHCDEFLVKARDLCGEKISICKILEEKRRIKLEKYKNAEIASMKNMQKWNQQREEHIEKIRVFRECQQKELQKELELIEERRLLKRMEEIQVEREYMDELADIEKEELEKENAELREKIKLYQKLNEHVDKKLNEEDSEVALEDIHLSFASAEDIINANNAEENTAKTDENKTLVKDELNNIVQSSASTEAQRNKLKVMSHEYNFSTDGNGINNNNNNNNDGDDGEKSTTTVLTDAQRNKLKVMGHEYNMIEEESKNKSKRPIISVQDYDKLSDLQKNRLKVLSSEFEQIEKLQQHKSDSANNNNNRNTPMTDLQRNRQRVLSHEFGYDEEWCRTKSSGNKSSPESAKLSLDLLKPESGDKQSLESPMSTTSDHFNSELNESSEKSAENDVNDREEQLEDENEEDDAELWRAFEEAVEKNRLNFMSMAQDNSSEKLSFESVTDTMSLSHFLQASLTMPLNAYLDVLNNEMLKMYIKDLDILSHFKSLRNYFLLMNGEYCSSICHEMFSKIEGGAKPIELLNYQALHMMLDQALSGSRYDPNTENLSFIVQNIPDKFELYSPGILNMLTLSYEIKWPLSLILNPEAMDQYKAIFNYLMKLKRINFSLEQSFQILKESHKQHGSKLLKSHHYRNVQHIRHKMTQFISCLENYVTRNVLQISWSAFIEDLKSAESILCIYRKHANYLKRIVFLCLLTKKSQEFYKSIEDLFKVILKFHKHLKSKSWKESSEEGFVHENYHKMQEDASDFDRQLRYMQYLGNKIVQRGIQKEMYDLLQLIDINGYYSKES